MKNRFLQIYKYSGLIILYLFIFNLSEMPAQSIKHPDTNAVKTIDGIINETLAFISGESKSSYNWGSFRLLFAADAQFMYLSHDKDGQKTLHTMNLEEFARLGMQAYQQSDFSEYELKKTIDEYNGIAHVFQSYEASGDFGSERGMNSYQLIFDGKRWWITSILWTDNKNGIPIPENYSIDP
ncbi:MAG: hypothetical protein K9H84_06285 [Bacteroidales bacterium]|nr:hypothetical protein [Bacteroidales bacterium]